MTLGEKEKKKSCRGIIVVGRSFTLLKDQLRWSFHSCHFSAERRTEILSGQIHRSTLGSVSVVTNSLLTLVQFVALTVWDRAVLTVFTVTKPRPADLSVYHHHQAFFCRAWRGAWEPSPQQVLVLVHGMYSVCNRCLSKNATLTWMSVNVFLSVGLWKYYRCKNLCSRVLEECEIQTV